MAKLRSSNIEPSTGTTLALGASGDAALISSDSIKANTWQDVGGNSLFVSDGSGTLSSVNSGLAGGGMTLILAQTATDSSEIQFTTGIDSTYDEYMLVFTDIAPAVDTAGFQFQANVSGQTGFNEAMTTTYWNAWNKSTGGSDEDVAYNTSLDQANGTAYQRLSGAQGSGAAENMAAIMNLYQPSNTTFATTFTWTCNYYAENDYAYTIYVAGYFQAAAALTELSFKMDSSSNFDGVIQLYGVA